MGGRCRERAGWGSAALTRVLQGGNQIGDAGAAGLGEGLKVGTEVTTLLVGVPGKPDELSGLICDTRGGLPPECTLQCNTSVCTLPVCSNAAECAKDVNRLLFMRLSWPLTCFFVP